MATGPVAPAPAPTLTAGQLFFQQWMSSNPSDPMRRLVIVMIALSQAESDVLTTQGNAVKARTDEITGVNNLMKNINTAAGTLTTAGDGDKAYVLNGASETEANQLADEIVAFTGVARSSVFVGYIGSDPFMQTEDWAVQMTKADLNTAAKNLQLKIDSLSGDAQQMQLFLQTLTGRITSTLDTASAVLKRLADMAGVMIDNTRHQ
jgi:hypothetical protein